MFKKKSGIKIIDHFNIKGRGKEVGLGPDDRSDKKWEHAKLLVLLKGGYGCWTYTYMHTHTHTHTLTFKCTY